MAKPKIEETKKTTAQVRKSALRKPNKGPTDPGKLMAKKSAGKVPEQVQRLQSEVLRRASSANQATGASSSRGKEKKGKKKEEKIGNYELWRQTVWKPVSYFRPRPMAAADSSLAKAAHQSLTRCNPPLPSGWDKPTHSQVCNRL